MATKTVEINGVEYTLQKVATNQWYKIKDRSKDKNGNPSEEKLFSEVLEHIVVSPKMKMADFEEVEDFEEVMQAAIMFQCKRAEPKT